MRSEFSVVSASKVQSITKTPGKQEHRVEVTVEPEMPASFADEGEVQAGDVNLLSNAIKFTPKGAG